MIFGIESSVTNLIQIIGFVIIDLLGTFCYLKVIEVKIYHGVYCQLFQNVMFFFFVNILPSAQQQFAGNIHKDK